MLLQQEELHNYERPISLLAHQNVEINRDRKKHPTPSRLEDFYFYANKELSNLPSPRYGAAAMELIKRRAFPSWGLFVYKDLKERAGDALPPELLCLQCDDLIILAPDIRGTSVRGMLIGLESASRTTRTLRSPCGIEVDVLVPELQGKTVAIEDEEIQLIRAPRRS
jgi:hypothetical protein